MIEVAARWTVRGISLLVLGPVAAWGAGLATATDGSRAASMLAGASPVGSLVALLVVAACLVMAAVVAARAADRHEAVLNLGLVMGWVAWTGGRTEEALRAASGAGVLFRFAIEGLLLAAVVAAALAAADRASRRASRDEGLAFSVSAVRDALRFKAGVPVLLVSVGAGLAGSWLFARYGAPGQGLGAVFLGGLIGGVIGSQTFESVSRKEKDAPTGVTGVMAPALLGVMLAGIAAPLIGLAMPGAGRLATGVARGDLPGWVLVSPASWVTGALIGVPAGVSMLKSAAKAEARPAASKTAAG